MSMVACRCGRLNSDLKRNICPACGAPIAGAVNKKERKGLFASKTTEELYDPNVTSTKELKTRQTIVAVMLTLPLAFLFYACMNRQVQISSNPAAEHCRIQADRSARMSGAPTYKYATAESSTNAKLHFSRAGTSWTTNYFC